MKKYLRFKKKYLINSNLEYAPSRIIKIWLKYNPTAIMVRTTAAAAEEAMKKGIEVVEENKSKLLK